ncbi:hypothetical protein, partial [Parabacteroides distasonis]|uniref:hypothetical protein n=1 Tax=Parabacteroides distasonis TaxID=823 RepID=UPI0019D655A0
LNHCSQFWNKWSQCLNDLNNSLSDYSGYHCSNRNRSWSNGWTCKRNGYTWNSNDTGWNWYDHVCNWFCCCGDSHD